MSNKQDLDAGFRWNPAAKLREAQTESIVWSEPGGRNSENGMTFSHSFHVDLIRIDLNFKNDSVKFETETSKTWKRRKKWIHSSPKKT